MKAVILAGGLGSRLAEETETRPKPMVEIGGQPILWHIMKIYSAHGIDDFVVCLGYKGQMIKDYFLNYRLRTSDITIDLAGDAVTVHRSAVEPWRITLIDTGADTHTGGRLRRVAPYVQGETFCMTYGDGVADIDIGALVAFHRRHGLKATVTAVPPLGRFGILRIKADMVTEFREKAVVDADWVNGGFFVLEPEALDAVTDDWVPWEGAPMQTLQAQGQLAAFRHSGFWHPMDTLRDRRTLEDLWAGGKAPWKIWP